MIYLFLIASMSTYSLLLKTSILMNSYYLLICIFKTKLIMSPCSFFTAENLDKICQKVTKGHTI